MVRDAWMLIPVKLFGNLFTDASGMRAGRAPSWVVTNFKNAFQKVE
jgi:hypothetical protein